MKLSSKATYGIEALFEIAINAGFEGITSRKIADARDIPLRFLEQVLSTLRKNKLVKSNCGRSGGYLLAKEPREITLLQAIEALEGAVSLAANIKKKSPILSTIQKSELLIRKEMANVTVEDLIKDKRETDKSFIYMI